MKILTIVSDVLLLLILYYPLAAMVYSIIGHYRARTDYPYAKPCRFAVLICARNEEKVIGNLLESLVSQDYPGELVTCFVVAHNCTDRTAQIAREHGAIVFEWNDPEKRTKGDALRYGVRQIRRLYPGAFDALCFFDADNLAGRDFLKEINAALSSGADVAMGFRRAKNYRQNSVSELFGTYWYQVMYTLNIPNTAMGLPAVVSGTGFAVTMKTLKDGWNTQTMLEDIEFTIQMILQGKRIIIAPKALFYDEQPSTLRAGLRQRYRWTCGEYLLLRRYLPRLMKAIPLRGKQVVSLLPVIAINPVVLLSGSAYILRGAASFALGGVAGGIRWLLLTQLAAWSSVLPITLLLFRWEKMKVRDHLPVLLLFPVFLMISAPLAAAALFDRTPKWKPVPHNNTTALADIEENIAAP